MNGPASPTAILAALNTIVLGKVPQLRLALACLLARGHLLIEDVPGVGKTTLACALARVLGLEYRRIQFTSDLLPSDVLGVSVYRREQADFEFRPGPVFAQLVLADELNRASARTQSALLEAMEERQVTMDGATRALPEPFFVVATLNPTEQLGTFALPESQLDRFLMRISLGYPAAADERALLAAPDRRSALAELTPLLDADGLLALQQQAAVVRTTAPLLDYILALVRESRERVEIRHGLSPRAGLALRRAAQALAFIEGRSGAIPEDVQRVFAAIAAHRLVSRNEGTTGQALAEQLLGTVAIP
ncbi:MAG: AAA family ATPase [Nevskiaceae bacterium]|nr:MAG: AAA family ATPase [Nevskiaceae bacterium]TBR74679.1 MAG: AAA family ATPase [Nevskiaceae bacterium]